MNMQTFAFAKVCFLMYCMNIANYRMLRKCQKLFVILAVLNSKS